MSTVPFYCVEVVAHDVASELRINDVPVLRLPGGGHVETSFDVNPYMQAGSNSISLRVAPGPGGFGAQSSYAVDLVLKTDPRSEDSSKLASLRFTAPTGAATGFEDSPGEVELRPGVVVATARFEQDAPFGPWQWTAAEELEATEAVRAQVLAIYQQIHKLLADRDVTNLMRACEGQARDWQVAYGLPDLATAQRALGIAETLADPAVTVDDFPPDLLTMELLGDRRLVQLVDERGNSPLRLSLGADSTMEGRFNVVLCRMGTTWTIAR
ncbi:MAG: hypothetical protein KC457_06745 [Myxococcales bacterium]|nr:hypothetical protein [Myxococcales bacterium]